MQCILEHVGTAGMSPQQENSAFSVKIACNEEFMFGPMIRHSSTTVLLANLTSSVQLIHLTLESSVPVFSSFSWWPQYNN